MSIRWEALNARARGLATHLLTRADFLSLARVQDRAGLATTLRRIGYPVAEEETDPGALDLALRRVAAGRLRVLARWCGTRVAVRTVLFEDEDRRSLRAVLRGTAQGAPVEARLAGLVPTPSLPERALRELAHQNTPRAVAVLLVAWVNPYGAALLEAASAEHPDLFRIELALHRAWAGRALRAGREEGGLLAAYVRETIDLENAYTALVLAGEGKDVVPKDAFLPGGERVPIDVFEMTVAGGAGSAGRTLAAAFARTPFARVFERFAGALTLEDEVLRARIRGLVRTARVAPLGPAPLLAYALRLRAEILDLRRIIWGVALAAPGDALARDLVSV